MRIDIISIFPQIFESFLETSLLAKGIERGLLEVRRVDLREFGEGPKRAVDDSPYGGGAGMVFCPQPLKQALELVQAADSHVIYFSPQGGPITQAKLKGLSLKPRLTLLCGRYEGIDERIIETHVDEELSLGDFVLGGGEVPAMALIEGVARLIPGFVKEYASLEEDSFFDGLLDHPHYTRPAEHEGKAVPPVLLSGNHAKIEAWRREQRLLRTARRRPDLLRHTELSPEERQWLADKALLPDNLGEAHE